MRRESDVVQAIHRHGDMVRRLCMLHLKNYADTEDIFQTVFLKYALHDAAFETPEHERAWLLRVTLNACRDLLKSVFRSRTVSLDAVYDLPQEAGTRHREVLEAVLSLPEKYRIPIYLHYYEGYTAPEMAKILKKNVNTVYTLLNRGKARLKEALTDEG